MSPGGAARFAAIENEIRNALSELLAELLTAGSCLALVREAKAELSGSEVPALASGQREKWVRLSAPSVSPVRRLEWSEARRCEGAIRERLGEAAATSIAHTRQGQSAVVFAIGAAAAMPGKVGIDVELRSRAVSEAMASRFIRDGEERFGLDPLQIWVIKEALFKADPENEGTMISAHSLVSLESAGDSAGGSTLRRGVGEIGGRQSGFVLLDLHEWVVAVAVSPLRAPVPRKA